jgi:hypothetical protein
MTSAPKALRIEQRLLVLARGMQEESFEGDREKICAVLIQGANTIIHCGIRRGRLDMTQS